MQKQEVKRYLDRQVWPWSTKWSRAKANRVLPREHTGHSQHHLPTTKEMTLHVDNIRLLIPKSDWLYSLQLKMEKLYTVSTRPGADCGSDHELLAKFRHNLKRVGKTTRIFQRKVKAIVIQLCPTLWKLKFSCFFYDQVDIGNLFSGSSAFSKSSLNIWKFSVHWSG